MKKLSVFVAAFLVVMVTNAGNGGKEKPAAVVSNYSEVLKQVEYPLICKQKGIEGTVLVKVSVDKNGEMRNFKVVETPCPELKEAVEKVIPNLDFAAPEIDGKSVSSKVVIPVRFKLTY